MFFQQSRLIVAHAVPMLIAQLASMGMMIIDTVVLGHYGTEDLAAAAVGSSIYVSVLFALVGVLQAVSPTVSQLKGAGRDREIAGALQQCFWLASLLAAPGVLFLLHPDALLRLSDIEPGVESKVRTYLAVLAWAIVPALFYRTFYAFCNALGQPRPLVVISFVSTLLHAALCWLLVHGWSERPGMGVLGAGIANALVGWFTLACSLVYMAVGKRLAPYRLFRHWQAPDLPAMRQLVRLGLPMGMSSFIEISSFTLTSLFIAQLGAAVVAGHRIVANLAAICYMLPLALSIATLAQVGFSVGANDGRRAQISAFAGMALACTAALILGGILWLGKTPLVAAYTGDPTVRGVALALIIYVAGYQVFDAIQTVAAFALRGYKITFVPMLVHLVCFWGLGLFGGWWLAFRGFQGFAPMGAAGFWLASLLSLVLAATLFGGLLWRKARQHPAIVVGCEMGRLEERRSPH